jgi:hypothetical protein
MAFKAKFLLTNIFPIGLIFNEALKGIDFFKVEGIFPRAQKYDKMGDVLYELEIAEKVAFAKYFKSRDEDFAIGFLADRPKNKEYTINGGVAATYVGKESLPPTEEGRRALLELIYNMQRRKLRASKYWNLGHNTAFPWNWENLYNGYKCQLNFFRGPSFRYYFLSDGQLILVLDTRTHYIESKPFLEEIRLKGKDLKWFQEEIEQGKERYEQSRRRFNGIYFHYIIGNKGVPINGVDPRPISDIPIEAKINGKLWKGNVYDYLKLRYSRNRRVRKLDPSQPAVCKGSYHYAPQLLHRHVTLKKVPRKVLNEKTFLMDIAERKEDRDVHSPARKRWKYLNEEVNSNFSYVDLGANVYKVLKPVTKSITTIKKPRLVVQKGSSPVKPENLIYALRKGAFKAPDLEEFFLFSVDDSLVGPFWQALKEYFENNFGWVSPEKPTLLEKSEMEIRNYLEKRRAQDSLAKTACIAILEREEPYLYKTLVNLFAEYNVPVQCLRKKTAISIIDYQRKRILEGICAGIFAKAGGIPWLLYDTLVYERYAAVDVGRQKAEWWAMGIVYDQRGLYEILPGEMIVGEDLSVEALRCCTATALSASAPNSFLILRDGDVSERELEIFSQIMSESKVQDSAIVSIKKQVPHRIFRSTNGEIYKPISGDFVELDENLILMCLAGVDRYQHGTPKPKLMEVVPVSGYIDPKDVARDMFYLSYMNWGSPSHGYSSPAPLRLAHVLASALSRGLRPFGPPF